MFEFLESYKYNILKFINKIIYIFFISLYIYLYIYIYIYVGHKYHWLSPAPPLLQ